MCLKPHIVHVVAYCEAYYPASAKEIIESCKIAKGAILLGRENLNELLDHPKIQERKINLIREANIILDAIRNLDPKMKDPLINPNILAKAVKIGILDAPHLKGSKEGLGKIETMPHKGFWVAIDPESRKILTEKERISKILRK
jgi:hypothetical protein